jgi:hypothetical protein
MQELRVYHQRRSQAVRPVRDAAFVTRQSGRRRTGTGTSQATLAHITNRATIPLRPPGAFNEQMVRKYRHGLLTVCMLHLLAPQRGQTG